MTKEAIKNLITVMQAYVNGKTIQYCEADLSFKFKHPGELNFKNKWVDVDEEHLFSPDLYDYRIKPSSKYRPFRNAEECWLEMLKHQPFGWLKDKNSELRNIQALTEKMSTIADGVYLRGINLINGWHVFEEAVKEYTFADGTPFGIRENF